MPNLIFVNINNNNPSLFTVKEVIRNKPIFMDTNKQTKQKSKLMATVLAWK